MTGVKKAVLIGAGVLSLLFCSLTIYAQVPWVKVSLFKNWGGLNDQLSETEIADNEASDIQNIIFDTGGALKKRCGYTTTPNNPVNKVATGSVVAITGLAHYQKNNGSRYAVAVTNNDSKATVMKKDYETGGGLETGNWENIDYLGLPSSYTNNNLPDFAVAEDNLIITIPATTQIKPMKWTGTGGVQPLTIDPQCPEATFVEYHKNHLFLAGDDDYPSRIFFSALDNIADYTATDFFDVQTSDGSRVRGFLSAYDSLYVFKDNSIWRLSGAERNTFILQKMVDGIGTLSHNSICVINNVIYFITSQGDIAIYDGAYTVKYISSKISNTLSDLNLIRAQYFLGLNFEDNFYASVTESGKSANNLNLVFDTDYNAWTKLKGINANAWCVGDDSNGQDLLIFGDTSGYVHTYPSVSYYDGNVATSAIVAFYETKWFIFSNLSLGDKYWRLLKTYALSETTSNNILYAECRSDYEASGRVVEINLSESGAKWDIAQWDVDLWSGQGLVVGRNEIEKGKEMFQIRYENNDVNEGFTLFGFDLFLEPTERI